MATIELPDEPRWIEANALLASGAAWTRPAGGGQVIGHDASALMVVVGDAAARDVLAVAAARPSWSLLAAPERDDLRAALSSAGWWVEPARLYTLPDAAALPDDDGAMPLPADAELGHLPPPLAAELTAVAGHGGAWTAIVEGLPVSFAFAPWRSPRWFDVSVETVPGYRQLGLATRVATALIRAERAGGREPVWGAVESNAASHRLAARLGFVAVDALWVATAP